MDTSTLESTVTQLAPIVAQVATEDAAHVEAITAEQAAEAALLARIVETVKPALRAMASRIFRTWRTTSGRNGCNPVEEKDYFDERGVCLVDAFTRVKDSTGNRGTYGGSRLYLLTDGRLAEVDREGTWSQWQGEWDEESCTLTVVDAATAQRHYHLSDIVEGLKAALDKQIAGKKPNATKAAQARAEKIAALARLVA
jgi:hypothetical protein